VIAAVADDVGLSESLRRGLSLCPIYLRLWLLSASANGISLLVVWVIARWLIRWTAESPSEMIYYWIVGVAAAASAMLVFFLTTAHDYARIRSTISGGGAVRAYAWALHFVTRGDWRALPLAGVLFVTGFCAWVMYQTVGMLIPVNSAGWMAVSLLWGQVLMLGRVVLRVWWFGAEIELQSMREA